MPPAGVVAVLGRGAVTGTDPYVCLMEERTFPGPQKATAPYSLYHKYTRVLVKGFRSVQEGERGRSVFWVGYFKRKNAVLL